ncbi:hypothetical protein CA51_16130 [Rosistilla oblonga]|nr:hypothetical protein CA51_16130 [Rosistilla oblonga]
MRQATARLCQVVGDGSTDEGGLSRKIRSDTERSSAEGGSECDPVGGSN